MIENCLYKINLSVDCNMVRINASIKRIYAIKIWNQFVLFLNFHIKFYNILYYSGYRNDSLILSSALIKNTEVLRFN